MQSIFLRALHLFRRCPALWLPVLAATLVTSLTSIFTQWFTHSLRRVALELAAPHSVTGAHLDLASQLPTYQWMFIGFTGVVINNFVSAAAFSCALGILTRAITQTPSNPEAEVAPLRWRFPEGWCVCALQILFIETVLLLPASLSAMFISYFPNAPIRFNWVEYIWQAISAVLILLANFILIRKNLGPAVFEPKFSRRKIFTVAAILVVCQELIRPHIIHWLFQHLDTAIHEALIPGSVFAVHVESIVLELFVAFLFIPVFIALVLLCAHEDPQRPKLAPASAIAEP